MDRKSIQSGRVWKHDVYLSVSGYNSYFICNLIDALQSEEILTFRADKILKKGESVPSEIFKAMEESLICIVIFTENYADSVWCLEELAKIAEGISQRRVLPVFYRVHPADVRKQSKYYEGAFAKYEEKFKDNLDKVHRWRLAMKHVASVKGWHAWIGFESEVIDDIVKYVMKTLGRNKNDDLVGMETRVKALENLLYIGSGDDVVRFVGISGMCGIGKTCLANVVYERISYQFDAHSFLFNISQLAINSYALKGLQEQLLCETLMEDNLDIRDVSQGSLFIRDHLRCRKTLLVLDNVDKSEQLEALAGNSDWFGQGSRIIVTTRDENILRVHGVDQVYKVELLNKNEALQLFCRIAFKCDNIIEGYKEWTHYALNYANGLPLAIQSLGSALFGQSPLESGSVSERLEEHQNNIMFRLQSSLYGLKYNEREIFLDIACFFNGKDESYVMRILDCCEFCPMIGIRALQDKSLINIVNGKIWMHDLLQQAGSEIIRGESHAKPEERSRLWLIKDFLDVIETDKGIKKVKAVALNQKVLQETSLRAEALSRMVYLRLLILHNVNFSGVLSHLSSKLQYVSWHKYPYTYLPTTFQPHRLVELIMPHSSIKHLWEGIKTFPNLRNMDLHGSKELIELPNFTGVPNLKRLNLEGCTRLLQINSSIIILRKLKFLNLKNCVSLVSIPNNLFGLSSLEILNLAGCSNLEKYLNFDPLRSSLEVKLLSNQYHSFLAILVLHMLIGLLFFIVFSK